MFGRCTEDKVTQFDDFEYFDHLYIYFDYVDLYCEYIAISLLFFYQLMCMLIVFNFISIFFYLYVVVS